MNFRRQNKAQQTLPPLNWKKLLVSRPTLPKQWWVSEAIQRGTSDSELRAQAAATLLLIPTGEELKPGSALEQLPELARRFCDVFESDAHFAASLLSEDGSIHPDIYRVAAHTFLLIHAACNAVNPPPILRDSGSDITFPVLVPELLDADFKAAKVVRALEARGLKTDMDAGPLLRDLPGHARPKAKTMAKVKTEPKVAKTDAIHPAEKFFL